MNKAQEIISLCEVKLSPYGRLQLIYKKFWKENDREGANKDFEDLLKEYGSKQKDLDALFKEAKKNQDDYHELLKSEFDRIFKTVKR